MSAIMRARHSYSSRLEIEHPAVLGRIPLGAEGDLGLQGQVRDRGAQLMGDVNGEVREPPEAVLQPRQHAVEGLYQSLQLARDAVLRHARPQLVGIHSSSQRSQPAQRPQPVTRGCPAEQGAHRRGGEDGQGQGVARS
jgi:hypothetical protein